MSIDHKWEFDAPQFVDFNNFELEDDGADEYFDKDHESKKNLSEMEDEIRAQSAREEAAAMSSGEEPKRTLRSGRVAAVPTEVTNPAQRLFVVGKSATAPAELAKPQRVAVDKKTVDKRNVKEVKKNTAAVTRNRRLSDGSPSTKKVCRKPVDRVKQQEVFDRLSSKSSSTRLSNTARLANPAGMLAGTKAGNTGRFSGKAPLSKSVEPSLTKMSTSSVSRTSGRTTTTTNLHSLSALNPRTTEPSVSSSVSRVKINVPLAASPLKVDSAISRRTRSASTDPRVRVKPSIEKNMVDTTTSRRRSKSLAVQRYSPMSTRRTVLTRARVARTNEVLGGGSANGPVEARGVGSVSSGVVCEDDSLEEELVECTDEMDQDEPREDQIEGGVMVEGGEEVAEDRENVRDEVPRRRRPMAAVRLTIPATPTILKRNIKSSFAPQHKPREQMEMDKIEELRLRAEITKKASKESLQRALAPPTQALRIVQPATKPAEFHFAVDERIKKNPVDVRKAGEAGEFAAGLRKHEAAPTRVGGRITQVQPFHLTDDRKRKRADESSSRPTAAPGYKFQTMGEKILQFTTKTPQRFRPNRNANVSTTSEVQQRHGPTQPKTPKLTTKSRARPFTHITSQAELDEQELEEMKKHQFKALPLDNKIFTRQFCAKPIASKPKTIIEPFDLAPDKRMNPASSLDDVADHSTAPPAPVFHANPFPKAIFEAPQKLKAVAALLPTEPKSPAWALKTRANRSRVTADSQSNVEVNEIRARPAPKFGEPFRPQLQHTATEIRPFSFENKTREMALDKEARLAQVLEEEKRMREFTAQPMPDLDSVHLPPKIIRDLTEIVPFDLQSDVRGAENAAKWKQKLEEEMKAQREAAMFKARPATVIHQAPFEPHKDSRLITPDLEPVFKLDERADKWKDIEEWQKKKDEELERDRLERDKIRLAQEALEIQQAREASVHHAQGVRKYKTLTIQPSTVGVTVPQSPRFSERLRPKHDASP